jgi:cell division protein FtsX
MLMNFLTILAWVGSVGGGLLFALCAFATWQYQGSIEQTLDRFKGVRGVWPWKSSGLVFLVSTAFLIAKAMS